MAAVAKIKFSQTPGPGAGTGGVALLGNTGTAVVVANDVDTDVSRWQFEVLAVPLGSAVATGIRQAYSTTATWSFTPDVTGVYVVRLRVKDAAGIESTHDLAFGVLESSGRLIPSFSARASVMNFGSQVLGWARYLIEYFRAVDEIESRPIGGFAKLADAAAATATAETPFGSVAHATTITAIKLFPAAALTANATNRATILIQKRTGAGAPTTVASLTTDIAGGSWSAFEAKAIPISAGAVLAGDVLTVSITKAGSGVIVPALRIDVFGRG